MKKVICFVVVLVLFLCGCAPAKTAHAEIPAESTVNTISADWAETGGLFVKGENGNMISPTGEEYVLLAYEWELQHIGELEFVAGVQGEEETSQHFTYSYKTGMYAINGDDSYNVLIRKPEGSEWCLVYRKASLPEFDFSSDNCIRLEYVPGSYHLTDKDGIHTTCGGGIVNKRIIASFFRMIKRKKEFTETRKYNKIQDAEGSVTFKKCATIYGFFEEEQNLIIKIELMSFGDLGYAVMIDGKFYELPELWVRRFEETVCNYNTES